MKFTLVKEIRCEPLMVKVLTGLSLFALLYLSVDVFYTAEVIGVDFDAVAVTLYGDPEYYMEPMETAVLLELWHASLFFAMMLMLTLSAIFSRLCDNPYMRIWGVNLLGISAIAAHLALPAAYFIDVGFVWMWLVGFWAWHGAGALMCIIVLLRLVRP